MLIFLCVIVIFTIGPWKLFENVWGINLPFKSGEPLPF